jgi:ribulose-phosphate 3-epimerase
MQIIPVINCPDAACVQDKLARLSDFYPADGWVHLDVTDGEFSTHATWADPEGWAALGSSLSLEVHLMVARPEEFLGPWIAAGAKRIIVHVESITRESAEAMIEVAGKHGVGLMLAINPETPLESAQPYFDLFAAFQILAVRPGPAGQEMISGTSEKILALRQMKPNAIIEIDGGINSATTKLMKAAGANIVAVGTYIFSAEDPMEAYAELKNI